MFNSVTDKATYTAIYIALAMLLLAGCATTQQSYIGANVVENMSGEVQEGFARAFEPTEFDFPLDHGAHPEYKTEWWYFTGALQDEAGNQYGYQFTLFRSALSAVTPERESNFATNQIYLAHFALTDVELQDHVSFERYSRAGGDLAGASAESQFQLWLEDWSVVEQASGNYLMTASAATEEGQVYSLDLTLKETRPPVLHGDSGLSQKGPEPGNASYYYSLVGLDTAGTITWSGNEMPVNGVSWMDHEFGSSALSKDAVGWDWFSAQLENGDVLMLAQIRTEDGGLVDEMQGTYVTQNGEQSPLTIDDYEIEVLGQWTSGKTGIAYPSGWRVSIPELETELEFLPLVEDQENALSFVYWEGVTSITGSLGGESVAGTGYVELTGYGSDSGDLRLQR